MSPQILRYTESKFLVINFFFAYKFYTQILYWQSLSHLCICWSECFKFILHLPPRFEVAIELNIFKSFVEQFAIQKDSLFPNSAIIHMMKYIFIFVSINCMVYFPEMYHRYIERIPATIMDGNTFCLYHWNRGKIKSYLRKCTVGIAIIVRSIFAR